VAPFHVERTSIEEGTVASVYRGHISDKEGKVECAIKKFYDSTQKSEFKRITLQINDKRNKLKISYLRLFYSWNLPVSN